MAIEFDPDDSYNPDDSHGTEIETTTTNTTTITMPNWTDEHWTSTEMTTGTMEFVVNATHCTIKVYKKDVAIGVLSGILFVSGNKNLDTLKLLSFRIRVYGAQTQICTESNPTTPAILCSQWPSW